MYWCCFFSSNVSGPLAEEGPWRGAKRSFGGSGALKSAAKMPFDGRGILKARELEAAPGGREAEWGGTRADNLIFKKKHF